MKFKLLGIIIIPSPPPVTLYICMEIFDLYRFQIHVPEMMMMSSLYRMRLLLLIVILISITSTSRGVFIWDEDYVICNTASYQDNQDPYHLGIASALTIVSKNTADNGYNYYATSEFTDGLTYGHGVCNGRISNKDCSGCLLVAQRTILLQCPNRLGAQLQLVDCRIRYEIYPFIE